MSLMQHSSKKQKAAVVTSVGVNALQSGVVTILEFLILIQHLEKYWYSIGHNRWSDHSQMSGMRWTYVGTGVSRVTSVRVIKCSRCRFIDSLEKKYWTHLKFSESIHIHTLIFLTTLLQRNTLLLPHQFCVLCSNLLSHCSKIQESHYSY